MNQKTVTAVPADFGESLKGMINARNYKSEELQRAYNRRSWLYSKLVAPLEFNNQLKALSKAKIKKDEKVLEVAVGAGKAFLEIMRRVGKNSTVYGVDISQNMLKITEKLVRKNGYSNYELKEANSRNLPFKDNFFDVLYNAYMLDLIPLQDMFSVLNEFKRVLKPGGRLVLLNMSKPDGKKSLHEKLYELLPSKLVLYLAGGCRPVLMEKSVIESGFQNISRSFLSGKNSSEIVVAVKPIMTITSKN